MLCYRAFRFLSFRASQSIQLISQGLKPRQQVGCGGAWYSLSYSKRISARFRSGDCISSMGIRRSLMKKHAGPITSIGPLLQKVDADVCC
jgi:hypothetical protein